MFKALSEARHLVTELDDSSAALTINSGSRYFAYNPGQQLAVRFADDARRIQTADGERELALSLMDTGNAIMTAAGSRVEYRHPDGLVEWWENRPVGLEQGFTVPASRAQGNAVRIGMSVDGMVTGVDPESPGDLLFRDDSGEVVMGYRDLKAWDAAGVTLAATMEPSPGGFEIVVQTEGARFPVVIDPLVVRAGRPLQPRPDGLMDASDRFASVVAVSDDHAALGVPDDIDDHGNSGSVHVFRKIDGAWTFDSRLRPGAPEKPRSGAPWSQARFGSDVSISSGRIFVTAPGYFYRDSDDTGAVFVYERGGNGWTKVTKLKVPASAENESFATSLAAAGDTLCVGGRPENAISIGAGRLWFFQRNGTRWKLHQSEDVGAYALDTDGDVTVASDGVATTLVFRRQGSTWIKEADLSPPGVAHFGESLDLDGDRVILGATLAGGGGAVAVFENDGAEWHFIQRIESPEPAGSEGFGRRVALAGSELFVSQPGDGSIRVFDLDSETAAGQVITPPRDGISFPISFAVANGNLVVGAQEEEFVSTDLVFTYSRTATSWEPTGTMNSGFNGDNALFNAPIAIGGDKAFVGAPGDSSGHGPETGSVYVFRRSSRGWDFEHKLMSEQPRAWANFGGVVAARSGRVVVGSPDRNARHFGSGTPAIEVFANSGSAWDHEASLHVPRPGMFDWVDMNAVTSGDRILIGTPRMEDGSGHQGSVFVFVKKDGSWLLEDTLKGEGGTGEEFGAALSQRNSTAWVGAPGHALPANRAGRVYGFEESGGSWEIVTRLSAADARPGDGFGGSLAMSGGMLWIGANGRTAPGDSTALGTTYVHAVNGVSAYPYARIDPPSEGSRAFGSRIAVSGDLAAIHSYSAESGGSRIELIQRGTAGWEPAGSIDVPTSWVPVAIAMHGDTLMVSDSEAREEVAPHDTVRQGMVHVFRIKGPKPDLQVTVEGKKVSNGKSLSIPAGAMGAFVKIVNRGKALLTDLEVISTGDYVVAQPLRDALNPGETTTFVIYAPAPATGMESGKITILSNDPDTGTFTIHMRRR
ncbi:hypothetical protein [Luteolibacter marinus]|uniref:hypothetical protein n=1 Tax=Luteolibacter marinus TaxID=2776705 RepID=UPI00186722E9|nr:hypothetical protein [Luteolibacter marinus]